MEPSVARILLGLLAQILLLKDSLTVFVREVTLAGSDVKPYALHGEPATLLCNYSIQATELVTEVEWEKEGSLVYLWTLESGPEAKGNLTGKVDLDQSTASAFTIKKVHKDMHGTYRCKVRTNGRMAHNEMYLMVIVDACGENSWKTLTNMIECTEDLSMHCVGIFPKPSPTCGVYSERTGRFLSSIHFDSVNPLHNGTFEVSFNRRFSVKDWIGHPDLSFRCYMVVLGTPWRSGITHKMFGDPGCENDPHAIQNGHFNISGDLSCWGHPGEGSNAEYYCHEPYTLQGTTHYVCSQGRWIPEGFTTDDQRPSCSDGNGASHLICNWIVIFFTILFRVRTFSWTAISPAVG